MSLRLLLQNIEKVVFKGPRYEYLLILMPASRKDPHQRTVIANRLFFFTLDLQDTKWNSLLSQWQV